MKKYFLTTLLLWALVITLIACGKSENVTTNDSADIENEVTSESDVQTDNEETSSSDIAVDTPSVTYEGIDFDSTLPGREWVQTTFPGVIEEPKIVIYNDETNKKQIVENGEMILFDEADTFAMYLPDGAIIIESSYLSDGVTGYDCCKEVAFDMEVLKEEYLLWKDVDGGCTIQSFISE